MLFRFRCGSKDVFNCGFRPQRRIIRKTQFFSKSIDHFKTKSFDVIYHPVGIFLDHFHGVFFVCFHYQSALAGIAAQTIQKENSILICFNPVPFSGDGLDTFFRYAGDGGQSLRIVIKDIEDIIPEPVHDGRCPHRPDVLKLAQKFQHLLLSFGSHRHRQVETELSPIAGMFFPVPVKFQPVADNRIRQGAKNLFPARIDTADQIAAVKLAEDAFQGAFDYFCFSCCHA